MRSKSMLTAEQLAREAARKAREFAERFRMSDSMAAVFQAGYLYGAMAVAAEQRDRDRLVRLDTVRRLMEGNHVG
jgi:hypothetical protein